MLMKVLVINPGATSTKISAFDEEKEVMRVSISHSAQELSKFAHIAEQMPYRKKLILDALRENGMKVSDFDAICGRGGLLRHIPSGTYAVTTESYMIYFIPAMASTRQTWARISPWSLRSPQGYRHILWIRSAWTRCRMLRVYPE